jgi:hypothetical protein
MPCGLSAYAPKHKPARWRASTYISSKLRIKLYTTTGPELIQARIDSGDSTCEGSHGSTYLASMRDTAHPSRHKLPHWWRHAHGLGGIG